MILLVTNERDTTADLVVLAAASRGVELVRLNTERAPDGEWTVGVDPPYLAHRQAGRIASSETLTGVWYRRPEAPQFSSSLSLSPAESAFLTEQWSDLIDGLAVVPDVRWVSRPHAIRAAENKIAQLHSARAAGFALPETCITNSKRDADAFRALHDRVIVKSLAGALIDDEPSRFVFTTELPRRTVLDQGELSSAPIVLQRQLRSERHLRLTVVGTEVFAAEVHAVEGAGLLDWRTSSEPPVVQGTSLPAEVAAAAVSVVAAFGLAFSSMDVVVEGGRYVFLDLNPNGEWGWLERGGGFPIADALVSFLSGP